MNTTPALLEAVMLVCFGIAWPLANLRMLRTRRPEGKGLAFTLVILWGYLCGAGAKLIVAAQGGPLAPVVWLYLLNTGSVGLNLFLQWRCGRGLRVAPAAPALVPQRWPAGRPGRSPSSHFLETAMPAFDRRPEHTADLDLRWITVPLGLWVASFAVVLAAVTVQRLPAEAVAADAAPAIDWPAA